MGNDINRIAILEKNIKGNLFRCNICKINFTAIQPCIMCQLRIEKEEKLKRKLTREEFCDIIDGIFWRAKMNKKEGKTINAKLREIIRKERDLEDDGK